MDRVIDIELPAELAAGSVVLDRYGIAWQRDEAPGDHTRWGRAKDPNTFDTCSLPWSMLLLRVPLTVLRDTGVPGAAG